MKSVDSGYKSIADKFMKSIYVDNCVTSVDSEEELQNFQKMTTTILSQAKMDLRQWEYGTVGFSRIGHQPGCGWENGSGHIPQELASVLGYKWDKDRDIITVDVKLDPLPEKLSKRVILSQVQKIYDPLGFLSPSTLVPKLLLQRLWQKKSSWDEELDENIKKEFLDWWIQVPELKNIHIPRYAFGLGLSTQNIQIHTFCDGSKVAFAAIVFIRIEQEEGVSVQLLQAKSRVAPIKQITIPRVELLGCNVASRLAFSVKEALSLEKVQTFYWTDSTTALAWIRRNDEWGTFVGNRVKEILQYTNTEQWHYVPGILNPADLPSRGCSPSKLLESRWWEGPSWLRGSSDGWPSHHEEVNENLVDAEKKKGTIAKINQFQKEDFTFMSSVKISKKKENLWSCDRFESFIKNIRHLAWILRFVKKCRSMSTIKGELTQKEIQEVEIEVWMRVQKESFVYENGGYISGLKVDNENGLLIVKTRILQRQDFEHFLKPILLPKQHPIVEKLIREIHVLNGHAGIQFLVGYLREKYWVIQSRRTIRKIISKCVVCRRHSTKSTNVPPAPLPENRIKDAAVFQVIGVDLAGPLFLKDGTKTWMVIFTCAIYRAIHLELVTSCSTETFLLALFRFISRRGRPSTIYSDNGKNFEGADNLFGDLDWVKITADTKLHRIQWIFNCPAAPWWGGFFERLIRNVKDLLKRMLGHSRLNYEQLITFLCEVEAVVNGRPLTYVTEDEDDLIPLTPSMFIRDLAQSDYPEITTLDGGSLRDQYKGLITLRQQLRQRFRKEYLSLLVEKGKKKPIHVFKMGDMVLIGDNTKKRLDWSMGRIIELIQGRDDHVRTARVKTENGSLLRPLQHLYPLEISSIEEVPHINDEVKKVVRKKKQASQQRQQQIVHHEQEDNEAVVVTRSGRKITFNFSIE
jgi:hypothetical protein